MTDWLLVIDDCARFFLTYLNWIQIGIDFWKITVYDSCNLGQRTSWQRKYFSKMLFSGSWRHIVICVIEFITAFQWPTKLPLQVCLLQVNTILNSIIHNMKGSWNYTVSCHGGKYLSGIQPFLRVLHTKQGFHLSCTSCIPSLHHFITSCTSFLTHTFSLAYLSCILIMPSLQAFSTTFKLAL